MSTSRKRANPQIKPDWLFLALLVFVPRLLNLDVFLTADEPLFLEHAREFAAAIANGNFGQTAGIGYPGVTVAAWAAPLINLPQTEMGAYVAGRVATGLLSGMLMLVLYALSRRLLGRWPAFTGVALLALDPYTLAYSRLLHIAAPLALFMALAGVSLLLWLRDERRIWLLLTGVFSGLALLTKSTALLLGPMLGLAAVAWAISNGHFQNPRWWLNKIGGALAAAGVAAITFFLLWPAMWVDPLGTLTLTFGKLFNDQQAGTGNLGLFWMGQFTQNPGPAFYPVAFLLKATPWLILGLILSIIQMVVSRHSSFVTRQLSLVTRHSPLATRHSSLVTRHSPLVTRHSSFARAEIISLWVFALAYLVIMTIASKKSIRYMLPAFPVFYLLAGAAFYQLTIRNYQLVNFNLLRGRLWLVAGIVVFLLAIFSAVYHPYYFTYYNPAVLGWRWAPRALLVGWGEGLDGAAAYLNARTEKSVSAWYEWLFPLLYHGDVQSVVPQENMLTAEKVVLYINQVQRDIPGPNIIHYFQSRRQPEHTIRLNGIDYAWVYPGPIAGSEQPSAPQVALGGNFGSELQLLGYNLKMPEGANSAIVTLYWRVNSPPSGERFVYLRLVDAAGNIWAKSDGPPVMGLWPAERWQPETFIEDAHQLPLPAGTPPDSYRLEVGVYNPATGQTLAASGQPPGPGGGLLLGEVPVAWRPENRLDSELPVQVEAPLSDNADLIGHTPLPSSAITGDILPLEMGWRESRSWLQFGDIWENYILFEWRQEGKYQAEQLDPLPLPIEQWGAGAVLRAQHNLRVPPTLDSGRYTVWAALHTGSDPAGEAVLLGQVDVTAPPHHFNLPPDATISQSPARLSAGDKAHIELAGYSIERSGQALEVTFFWKTSGPISIPMKVFAQLLDNSNNLAGQSDAVPGGGQRPTTGWLPGEIIADSHTLPLPENLASGEYRLIAGFYNPVDGRRLPVIDQNGDAVGDYFTVGE